MSKSLGLENINIVLIDRIMLNFFFLKIYFGKVYKLI